MILTFLSCQMKVILRELATKNKTESWALSVCCTQLPQPQEGSQLRPGPLLCTSSVAAAAAAASERHHGEPSTQARLPPPHWCSQPRLLPLFGYVQAGGKIVNQTVVKVEVCRCSGCWVTQSKVEVSWLRPEMSPVTYR